MGRPPCCDKVGVKKGPWTPEEDIILVSYIQDHGPGNWRSVPTNTGLLRCSKSCRLRWTNYLRPGIKRGNFTPHEEGMIIHLQALLGNKWAAIASYLPQRTDNDIKNYWNTHLKKKIKRSQSSSSSSALSLDHEMALDSRTTTPKSLFGEKRKNEDDMIMSEHVDASNNTNTTLRLNHNSSLYASSTENISRLLEGWMRSSPPKNNSSDNYNNNNSASFLVGSQENRVENPEEGGGDLISNEEFDSIMCFDNLNTTTSTGNNEWLPHHKSQAVAGGGGGSGVSETDGVEDKAAAFFVHERKQIRQENNPPLSFLENWLLDENAAHVLDENAAHVEEMMKLPLIF